MRSAWDVDHGEVSKGLLKPIGAAVRRVGGSKTFGRAVNTMEKHPHLAEAGIVGAGTAAIGAPAVLAARRKVR